MTTTQDRGQLLRRAAVILDAIGSLAPLGPVAPDSDFTDLGTLMRAAKFQRETTEWDRRREALAGLPGRLLPVDLVEPTVAYLRFWLDRCERHGEAAPDLLVAAARKLEIDS